MDPSAPSILAHWESFYVIVGSSAAALTGLMFVVITLIADSKQPPTLKEINAFATPAVVHFSGVLVAPMALRQDHHWALYAIGAVALLLLFVGIHNAWDTVTYIIVSQRKKS